MKVSTGVYAPAGAELSFPGEASLTFFTANIGFYDCLVAPSIAVAVDANKSGEECGVTSGTFAGTAGKCGFS